MTKPYWPRGLSRRQFLHQAAQRTVVPAVAAGVLWPGQSPAGGRRPDATAGQASGETASRNAKTILGIGAHYDDLVFGLPGTMLKAVKRGHRVVVMSLIGDYENWKPAQGRSSEIVAGATRVGREYGVETRFLEFTGMKFEVNETAKTAVARAVADISPNVAFLLWPRDRFHDHEVASTLSLIALRHAGFLIERSAQVRPAERLYYFDNGPGHTIGFEPDTFVDISDEWSNAQEWLGKLAAVVSGTSFDSTKIGGSQRAKEALARYRGYSCGVRFAEALKAFQSYPTNIF